MANKTYKVMLEAEVVCPQGAPERTIGPDTVFKSLMNAKYAVCDRNDMRKLTADLIIRKVDFSYTSTETTVEHHAEEIDKGCTQVASSLDNVAGALESIANAIRNHG